MRARSIAWSHNSPVAAFSCLGLTRSFDISAVAVALVAVVLVTVALVAAALVAGAGLRAVGLAGAALVAEPDVPDVVTGSSADATDDRLALMAALQRVPPRQRACLVLRFFDDCSVEETSRVLGCSEGTVKSNTARGLDALRSRLRPDLTIRSNPS